MKKESIIPLALLGIAMTGVFLLCRRSESDHKGAPPAARERNATKREYPPSPRPSSPEPAVAPRGIVTAPQLQLEDVSKWVAQHRANVTILQSSNDGDFNRGTIREGLMESDLGESPPRYHFQLKGGRFSVLLGEEDDRNAFHRTVTIVRQENGRIVPDVQLTMTWTKWAMTVGAGGFVFYQDQADISKIGIMIPNITRPPGTPADAGHYSVDLRLEHPGRYIDPEVLDKVRDESLDDSKVVLMGTVQPMPRSARVLWFNIGENGDLELE